MRRLSILCTLALALLAPSQALADSGSEITAITGCGVAQTFLGLGDVAWYTPVPGGTFTSASWSVSGGARIVRDELDGDAALRLDEAQSGAGSFVCRDTLLPLVRFSVRNAGATTGRLRVELRYVAPSTNANARWVTIASIAAGKAWAPSAPLAWATPATGATLLGMRLTAEGVGASFRIDDVFVDPYRRR